MWGSLESLGRQEMEDWDRMMCSVLKIFVSGGFNAMEGLVSLRRRKGALGPLDKERRKGGVNNHEHTLKICDGREHQIAADPAEVLALVIAQRLHTAGDLKLERAVLPPVLGTVLAEVALSELIIPLELVDELVRRLRALRGVGVRVDRPTSLALHLLLGHQDGNALVDLALELLGENNLGTLGRESLHALVLGGALDKTRGLAISDPLVPGARVVDGQDAEAVDVEDGRDAGAGHVAARRGADENDVAAGGHGNVLASVIVDEIVYVVPGSRGVGLEVEAGNGKRGWVEHRVAGLRRSSGREEGTDGISSADHGNEDFVQDLLCRG